MIRWQALAAGVLYSIPGVYRLCSKTGGSNSARYCYSVWMRHLIKAYESGLIRTPPNSVAELGPGDSLGCGLAAILSGTSRYYALEYYPYANSENNLKVFKELICLFENKSPIPTEEEFPSITPRLKHYNFPDQIISNQTLENSLRKSRIEQVIQDLGKINNNKIIHYYSPWLEHFETIEKVQMIFSQSVLEHVDELEKTYAIMKCLLKDDGVMSHNIDFKSHCLTSDWNGHWKINNFLWTIIRGRRPFLINRAPISTHLNYIKSNQLKLHKYESRKKVNSITPGELSHSFKNLSRQDLTTCGAYIQCTH